MGNGIIAVNGGLRLNYRPAINEFLVSPRGRISYRMEKKRVIILRLSGGLYHQTPFFKEMIAPNANLMKDIESQKSIHVVAGSDIDLKLWGRPFKFVCETYYKHIYNLIPYNIDNVKIINVLLIPIISATKPANINTIPLNKLANKDIILLIVALSVFENSFCNKPS